MKRKALKSAWILILPALLFFAAPAGAKNAPPIGNCNRFSASMINRNLDQGISAYDRRDYGAALAEIEKARSTASLLCPQSGLMARVIYWHGFTLYAMGKLPEAEKEFAEAIALAEKTLPPLHPWYLEMLSSQADLFFAQGRYEDAERVSRKALALAEQAPEPDELRIAICLDVLGRTLSKTGRYDEARQALTRSLALKEGKNPIESMTQVTLMDLGIVYFREGDLARAEEYFLKSLEVDPTYYKIHHNLGTINYLYAVKAKDAGDKEKAQEYMQVSISYFRRAIEFLPNAESYNDLGVTLKKAADITDAPAKRAELLDEAFACYEQAIMLKPEMVKPHINKGVVRLKQGRNEEAKRYFDQAVKIAGGSDPSPYLVAGKELLSLNEYEKAADYFDQCLEHFPGNQECLEGRDEARNAMIP